MVSKKKKNLRDIISKSLSPETQTLSTGEIIIGNTEEYFIYLWAAVRIIGKAHREEKLDTARTL